jgi:hypothetical protein
MRKKMRMQRFFAPCHRYNDLFRQEKGFGLKRGDDPHTTSDADLKGIELIVDIEDVFAGGFSFWDWSKFVHQGRGRIVWISERACISIKCLFGVEIFQRVSVDFEASDSAGESGSLVVCALDGEELASACNLVLRLLLTSKKLSKIEVYSISAPDLSELLKAPRPCLEKLTLKSSTLDEDHCRVLAAASRPGLEIVLENCKITNAGARIFAESFRLNQGPTKLICCRINSEILAEAMRGNTVVNTLTLKYVETHELYLLARALQEDRGLVKLDFASIIGPETLGLFCLSLKTHPLLETIRFPPERGLNSMKNHWMNRVVEMLQVNTVVQTVVQDVELRLLDHVGRKIYRNSVRPLLNRNILRNRLGAIHKAPMALRQKLLGRALQKYRMDPDRMWMLVSDNGSDVLLVLGERGGKLLSTKEPDEPKTGCWQKLKERLKHLLRSLSLLSLLRLCRLSRPR